MDLLHIFWCGCSYIPLRRSWWLHLDLSFKVLIDHHGLPILVLGVRSWFVFTHLHLQPISFDGCKTMVVETPHFLANFGMVATKDSNLWNPRASIPAELASRCEITSLPSSCVYMWPSTSDAQRNLGYPKLT